MSYYRKNASMPTLILPGIGRVYDVDIVQGDYAQYVPHYLYEVDVNGNPLPRTPPPPQPTAPAVAPEAPTSGVPVTHTAYPTRPPPPPELAKAWEERRTVSTPRATVSMEDALALAAAQTVPLPEETPAVLEASTGSPAQEIAGTMEQPVEPPKRKRGRPRKVKPDAPPTGGA